MRQLGRDVQVTRTPIVSTPSTRAPACSAPQSNPLSASIDKGGAARMHQPYRVSRRSVAPVGGRGSGSGRHMTPHTVAGRRRPCHGLPLAPRQHYAIRMRLTSLMPHDTGLLSLLQARLPAAPARVSTKLGAVQSETRPSWRGFCLGSQAQTQCQVAEFIEPLLGHLQFQPGGHVRSLALIDRLPPHPWPNFSCAVPRNPAATVASTATARSCLVGRPAEFRP